MGHNRWGRHPWDASTRRSFLTTLLAAAALPAWARAQPANPDVVIIGAGAAGLAAAHALAAQGLSRSEEHTSELQSLMRISYAVFCLKKKNNIKNKSRRCENN